MRLLRCDDTSAMTLDVGGVFWQEAVGAEEALSLLLGEGEVDAVPLPEGVLEAL